MKITTNPEGNLFVERKKETKRVSTMNKEKVKTLKSGFMWETELRWQHLHLLIGSQYNTSIMGSYNFLIWKQKWKCDCRNDQNYIFLKKEIYAQIGNHW